MTEDKNRGDGDKCPSIQRWSGAYWFVETRVQVVAAQMYCHAYPYLLIGWKVCGWFWTTLGQGQSNLLLFKAFLVTSQLYAY